jgi:DNA topoisomerase-1
VNWGKINATIPKGTDPASLTLEQAVELLAAKAASGPAGGGRALGEHPEGGVITLRAGKYGPYVSHGKVNATLPKGTSLDDVTLIEAIRLIEEKGGPVKKKPPAKKAAAAKAKTSAKTKKAIADSDETPFDDARPVKKAAATKKAPAKKQSARSR